MILTDSEIDRLLDAEKHRRRARRGGAGLGSGAHANAAWKTWINGDKPSMPSVPWAQGVDVRFRTISDGSDTRVTVFRGGMRITDTARNLEPSEFSDCEPFDAVVNAMSDDRNDQNCLAALLRDCETGSHLEINPANAPQGRREPLLKALRDLRGQLRNFAGQRQYDEYAPPVFQQFSFPDKTGKTKAREAPAKQYRQPSLMLPTSDTASEGDGDRQTDGNEEGRIIRRGRKSSRKRSAAPAVEKAKPGNTAGIRASVAPKSNDCVRVVWQAVPGGQTSATLRHPNRNTFRFRRCGQHPTV